MATRSHSFTRPSSLMEWLTTLAETNRNLLFTGLASIGLMVATAVLLVVDPRIITGAPAWVKPMKFGISVAIYSTTLLWMLTFVRDSRPKLVNLVSNVTAAGLIIELVIITLQAARGEMSHYNMTTPLNTVLYNTMAFWIAAVWAMNVLAAVLLLRHDFTDKALAWGIRMGLIATVIGAGLGFTMTAQGTEAQMQTIEETGEVSTFGAHSVGVEDGGPGLPFVGWSTEGGDIRVAHFVGLHSLQVLPLVGWLIGHRFDGLTENRQRALVIVGGVAYIAFVLLLLWQALRGQPVIAPDVLTLANGAGIIGASSIAAALIIRGQS